MKFKVALSKYSLDRKLQPGDPVWKKFNAGFKNVELKDLEIARAVYDGRAITTWHKDNWRTSENYICGQHVGLDFDNENIESSLDYLLQDKFILRYANFMHTTISHRDDAPRSRVMFLLDQPIMNSKNYVLAVRSLLWLYDTADRQCKDAVRFFYGSPGCVVHYVGQVLPISVVKKLIVNFEEANKETKRYENTKKFDAPATQAEVYEALKLIPPWQINYDEWLQVLMGIHSEFGDQGYSMAETWADGKQGEVEQKWKSFKKSGNEGNAITIATVFSIAKNFGWKKEKVEC